nr:small integral membrane protein 26-like [Solea senegalensis]
MKLKDLAKWNKRVSAAYAIGIWSMVVSYGYFKYTGRYEGMSVRNEEETQEPEDPNKFVHQTAHSKTVMVYKKDFVPYSTQIQNFISTLFSSGPGSGDVGK